MNEINTVNITMTANAAEGTVYSSAGGGVVSGANITIGGIPGTTDSNGDYFISGIPAGNSAAVSIFRSGFKNYSNYVKVTAGETLDYNFTITADPGNVTGTVSSSAGGNLPNVTVTVAGVSGTTDQNGNYTLTGVPAGPNMSLTASKAGYSYSGADITVVSDGTVNFNFTMTSDPGTVKGTVSSSAGGKLPNVMITL